MTDLEFISLFNVEELPECAQGLLALKRWVESDPEAIRHMQSGRSLALLTRISDEDLMLYYWLEHLRTCPTCLLLNVPSLTV